MSLYDEIISLPQPCPNCQDWSLKAKNIPGGRLVYCAHCGYSENQLKRSAQERVQVPEPIIQADGRHCPICGAHLRNRHSFWGCARFPKCSYQFWFKSGKTPHATQRKKGIAPAAI